MQIVVMITSVLVSAIISWLVARLQVRVQVNQKQKEHLESNQQMLAKWVVYENDMIKILQTQHMATQLEDYQKAERNLVVQMALIGLEYHDQRYDELLQKLTTFINRSRDLQRDYDSAQLNTLISFQREINEDLRKIIKNQYQN